VSICSLFVSKTDDWPATLHMLLVQKSLLSSVGNAYFQRTHKVIFYPDQCPALESLTASLSQGCAGCIHLSSSSTEVKMIILLYAADRKVFVGVIPLDQVAFVTKMNQVFQNQHRNMQQSQALTKQNDNCINHEQQLAENWNNFDSRLYTKNSS
ncbi:Mediator of RNA polymerase II transcription subunit 25, partial [Armadillidium vulgare]